MSASNALQAMAPGHGAPDAGQADVAAVDPVLAAKLWRNPCWLSFRFNFLALRYNGPLYAWVRERFGLSRPEFAVLYTLGLHDGALARDVGASYGFPPTTLSRASAKLARLGLMRTEADPADRRGRRMLLTDAGAAVLQEAAPRFVAEEGRLLEALDREEQATLSRLLAKIVTSANAMQGEERCASKT